MARLPVPGSDSGTWGLVLNEFLSQSLQTDGSLKPFSASGDLSGNFPNPSVAKINGVSISGTPSNGQTLTASNSTAASWSTPASQLISSVVGQTGAITGSQIVSDTALQNAFVGKGQLVINVRDYGAKGDGVTDDGPAIRSAKTAANGGILFFPPGTYYYKATATLILSTKSAIRGVSGASIINIDVSVPGAYAEFARNNGDQVTIEGIILNRVSDFPCVMLPIQPYTGFTIKNCTFNGNFDIYSTNYCHGIQTGVSNSGASDKTFILSSSFTKLSYGLFQTNASTATVKNFTVRDCFFNNNYSSDLEFNSPNGTQSDITVVNCRFKDNQGTSPSSGFGVGLAHVTRATVRDCTFSACNNEAVHIEDYSYQITIEGNKFFNCAIIRNSYIQVISGSQGVEIINNNIDATANSNFVPIINCQAGGTGLTPGGRAAIAPRQVSITGNNIDAGGCHGIYIEVMTQTLISHNRLTGASFVSGGVFGGGNGCNAINLYDGSDTIVDHNIIRGFGYAFALYKNTITAFNNGAVLSNNLIEGCNYGICAANAGPAAINGNMLFNCVHPFILGQGGAAPHPVSAVGNYAYGCTYRMEIGGVLIVISSGNGAAVTTGTGKTLSTQALGLQLPTGTVVPFSGGGTLTLTTAGAAGATSIIGDVTGAAINNAEVATVTGITYSSIGARNHLQLFGNADSVTATYSGVTGGLSTLVAGSATINDKNVTANTTVRLQNKTIGGTAGALYISTKTAGASFVISSTSNTDTSTIQYEITAY